MKAEVHFTVTFLILFACLYGFNLGFIAFTAPGGYYLPWLDNHFNYIEHWRTFNIGATAYILEALGYTVKTTSFTLYVSGRSGFKLVYSCLGYGIMSFLTSFALTYPKPIRSRFLHLISGLLLIQTLNHARFLMISLYWNKAWGNSCFDHHLAFNICIYLVVITILYKWVNSNS